MRDIFIGDAHLASPDRENYRRLLVFLEGLRGRVRTLYLLGDIFEFWVGYRSVVFAPYVPLLESLRRLRQDGAELVYVEGNHDFRLGSYFSGDLGCRILPDGGVVEIDGRNVLLAHGDLINPADRGYRILRRVLRSRPAHWLMAALPPDLTWAVAHLSSRQSKKTHARKKLRWDTRQLLRDHAARHFAAGCQAVVTGHFHQPLLEKSEAGTLLALGDWIEQYSYGVYEAGEFRLERFE